MEAPAMLGCRSLSLILPKLPVTKVTKLTWSLGFRAMMLIVHAHILTSKVLHRRVQLLFGPQGLGWLLSQHKVVSDDRGLCQEIFPEHILPSQGFERRGNIQIGWHTFAQRSLKTMFSSAIILRDWDDCCDVLRETASCSELFSLGYPIKQYH